MYAKEQEKYKIVAAAIPPALLLFLLFAIKVLEAGTGWSFVRLGVYPMQMRGVAGIVTHPLVHGSFRHLLANAVPLFFLSWCLFYFYRQIAFRIYLCLWLGCGTLIFCFGSSGWHVGASGLIYGLAFFLFFSGLLRRHVPLTAISLLVTFLYGGIVWNMFPPFARVGVSWEGHLGGAIAGTLCSVIFRDYGPQRPDPFADEEDEDEEAENEEAENEEAGEETATTDEPSPSDADRIECHPASFSDEPVKAVVKDV